MPIVSTNIPITSERNTALIQALAKQYPILRVRQFGTTAFGRPLWAMTIGSGTRKVIYSAAHHANEWITAYVLLRFAEELAEAITTGGRVYGVPASTLAGTEITLVPLVNPDGVDLVTGAIQPGSVQYELARTLGDNYPDIPFPNGWKANLLGVDLNLQYPAKWLLAREIKFSQGYTRPGPRDFVGRAPLNQLESRALSELTEEIDPDLVLAYHTQGKVIYWQFDDIQVPGAQALAEDFARTSGYGLETVPAESANAGYKDWFIQNFRRPGFTIEVGQGENPLPLSQFDEIYKDNLGILTAAATGLRENA
jgi:g-D-glutamyl-meso-diaminopimelate peptidase